MTIIADPLQFPATLPSGYPPLESEPTFDAAKHLALDMPTKVTSLGELGYSDEAVAACPTDLGITSTFRILTDEGAACLLEVARSLTPYIRAAGERVPRMVRGGVYHSKFLRDFCTAPELTEVISKLCGAPMHPHTIPHQLGHLNYNPLEVGRNVDKWHVDTLRVDFVLFVTDPNNIEGGEFEYFNGTVDEVRALREAGKDLPEEKIMQAELPGPGYAVLQQGNMVVHRAKGLREEGERITLVNGYVPADVSFPDYSRYDQLCQVDPDNIAASEYARHVAWMGREALNGEIGAFQFSPDREAYADKLDRVASLLSGAAEQLRAKETAKIDHFGD